MNDINLVVLEGKVIGEQKLVKVYEKVVSSTFFIKSVRYDGIDERELVIEISATGKLANICANNIKANRIIMVTGWLEALSDTSIYIKAEHID